MVQSEWEIFTFPIACMHPKIQQGRNSNEKKKLFVYMIQHQKYGRN